MTTHRDLTTPELRPCPFCGEPPVAKVVEGSTFRWRFVLGCCTPGPEVRHNTMADDQEAAERESTADAIAAWNRRPRTFTAAEVAEAFAGLEAKWRDKAAECRRAAVGTTSRREDAWLSEAGWHSKFADELHERITQWLRENEG
jgi:hypothetical protein